jgi:phosphatidylserine/phosphatidylglycerophosphate/cardiolipin synthase-like enzyme
MNATWFQTVLDEALGTMAAGATAAQRDELLRRLLQLSRANGGEVVGELPEPIARARAVTAAEDAITAFLRTTGADPGAGVGLAGLVGRVTCPGEDAGPWLAAVTRELEGALAWVRVHPFARYRGRPVESARRANEQATQEAQGRWLLARAHDDVEGVALVRDEAYLPLAVELIEAAQSSIRVVMLRIALVTDDAGDPARRLVDALVEAQGRGVEVRVLLDQAEGSARFESLPAAAALAAAGIVVRWGEPERVTHTSLVVLDRSRVLLGSHAWTPESLRLRRETSVYVESPALGQHYFDVFGGRFDAAYG